MATFTFSMTVGATTASDTLTVPDAKAVEFLDLLRNLRYASGGAVPTRAQAATKFIDKMTKEPIAEYRRLKEEEARIARNTRPDTDLTT